MHYRMVTPPECRCGQVLQQTLAWLSEERVMQTDRTRLSKACCSPGKFATLQGAPLPVSIEPTIANSSN